MNTTQPQAEASRGGLSIEPQEVLAAFRRRKWLILGSTIAVAAAVAAGTARQPKIYAAKAKIVIEPVLPNVLGEGVGIDNVAEQARQERVFNNTQYMVITSRAILVDVAARLGLAEDDAFKTTYGLGGLEGDALERAIEGVLRRNVSVSPEGASRVVNLLVEDQDADRAARIANTLGQAYIDYSLERRLETTRGASEWLDKRVVEFADRLEKAEKALYEFKKTNMLVSVSLEDRQNMTAASMSILNQKLVETRSKLIELEAQLELMNKFSESPERAFENVPQVANDQVALELRRAIVGFDKQQAELSTRYGSKHPSMLAIDQQKSETMEQLNREVQRIRDSLANQIRTVQATEAGLAKAMANEKAEAMALNNLWLDYSKLSRNLGTTRTMYQSLLKRQTEADLSGMLKSNFTRWFEQAEARQAPIRPSLAKNTAIGLVIGLLLGLIFAVAGVLLDNTVHNQDDIESHLRLSFLGFLPRIQSIAAQRGARDGKPVDRDRYILEHPKSAVAECARSIRTNLLFMGTDRPLRRLLFTSARPAEGKTTSAITLGITMAQAGNKVILIDTDLRKPRLHKTFGVSAEVGLTSSLVDPDKLDEAIKSTPVVGLDVLPCGPLPPNPAELLHSERFSNLLEELSRRYDRVLLDSPPVGAVTDATILSNLCDGTLLVVQANNSPKDAVRRAARQIQDVGANLVGVVLNDIDIEDNAYGYGAYQYYRYSYGSDETEAKA